MTPAVKICGITNIADARAAVEAGADFLGFVFYAESQRFISPQAARKIIRQLPRTPQKVGVFVNETPERVKAIAGECGLDLLQFHGDESREYLKGFRGYRLIKAIRVQNAASFRKAGGLKPDFFLFDTFKKGIFGGTGAAFDWRLFEKISRIKTPFFISGGLTPENVGVLLRRVAAYGVDVSSGVEARPGKKSAQLIKEFVKATQMTHCESARCGFKTESR
jgi:phosphoribosylanthranilate isomerase